ncbi:hypothetical protein PLESTB_001561700 [Pleodorina starrii]|uniref:Aminopeptidase P N-terminal domain-containing protein n=1 Tax=Pleodorina starrii TaxID=330485 RepID=A0A9W6BXF4_9CHLO|nr:hypothetical protein PLESTM_001477900 [Pleodorina starrii]GLC59993.1 hypothetical protein PLESTB_001561700 [Pleodorina starrii]GLC72779.1 hypothetical protein PLESTF_001292300 [Pleodorina starrii]
MLARLVAGCVAGHQPQLITPATNFSLLGTGFFISRACGIIYNASFSTQVSRPSPPAGQPTAVTHPELVAPHELTPGIPASEYRERRHRLGQLLPPGGAAVLPAAATTYMSGVIPWPYRQDPDFFYLTGLMQHGMALLSAPAPGSGQDPRYTLFIDAPNANRERWDGATVSREAALEVFGADEVFLMHEMPRKLSELAKSGGTILYDTDRVGAHHHNAIAAALRPALEPPGRVVPLRPLLHSMRLIKSRAEAALMATSAAIASAAVRHCMAVTAPGTTEYGLAAAFEYDVKSAGAQRLAYPSVVAGGPDACTIHYGRNDKVLAGGQVVLMDAGAEYWGYVSDVTRTWPVGGSFSGPQRDVYAIVLEAHQRCLAACRPGSSIRELHSLCIDILSEGLRDLRLLPGASLAEIRNTLYREFFWHSLGHYLGLDTHDTHLIGHERRLEEGAVITVEPGLYIPDLPQFGAFRGIGVRIEDDVLLTAAGCQVLSDQAPVSIAEVEELAGSAAAASASSAAGVLPQPPRSQAAPHRRLAPGAAAREEAAATEAVSSSGPARRRVGV